MSSTVDLKVFHPYKVDGLKRIGNTNDGGYVIHYPSLASVDCLINYGVGYNMEFEKEFNKITNKPVYAFDPTMKKMKFFVEKIRNGEYVNTLKQFVKLLLWLPEEKNLKKHNINFIEEGLAANNTEAFKTFEYHLNKYNLQDKKVFLKIDIEGAEYEVMGKNSFYDHLDNVVQLTMELHYVGKNIERISEIISKLAKTHSLVHIHGNNNGPTFTFEEKQIPEVIEVAFLHNSFFPNKDLSELDYPVEGLDYPCNRHRKDIKLDFFKEL